MNSFLRRLMNYDLVVYLAEERRKKVYEIERLQAEMGQLQLAHARNVRDLIENFWIVQEAGLDVREELEAGLQDLRDHVARLEEHAR